MVWYVCLMYVCMYVYVCAAKIVQLHTFVTGRRQFNASLCMYVLYVL